MNETIKNADVSAVESADESVARIGNRRWSICALLFFAATVNYVDRQVIGILKPTLAAEFGWTEIDYGWIVFGFQTAYAIGLLFVGKLMDKIGTKKGFSLSIVIWSVGAMLHAWAVIIGLTMLPFFTPIINGFVSAVNVVITALGFEPWAIVLTASVLGFIIARFILGIGEAGNFSGFD